MNLKSTQLFMKMKNIAAALPSSLKAPGITNDFNLLLKRRGVDSILALRERFSLWIIAMLVVCLALIALPRETLAQPTPNPPSLMTYQGYLVDANGTALATNAPKNYDVVFRVYTASTGGSDLWSEQQTVTVDKGYFSVLLGEGSQYNGEPHPALAGLFATNNASDRYVEITVKGIGSSGGDVTILPRLRLLTSPYAFLAQNAVNANTATSVSGTAVTSGTVPDARLSGNVALLNTNQTFTGQNAFDSVLNILSPGSLRLNDAPIYLRSGSDTNHGLVYNSSVDGPALYGNAGGLLGTTRGGFHSALQWNTAGVTVNGISGNGNGLTNLNAARLNGIIPQSNLGATNSFTPVIGDGAKVSFTLTSGQGYYTKIGNLVFVEIWIVWNSKNVGTSDSSSPLRINLPFSVESQRALFTLGYTSGIGFSHQLIATASKGDSSMQLFDILPAAGPVTVTLANCNDTGEIQLSGFYRIQ